MDFFKPKKKPVGTDDIDDAGYYDPYDTGDSGDMGYTVPRQEESIEPERPAVKRNLSFGGQVNDGPRVTMMLMKPSTYEEGRSIADQLMNNRAVIMNLENANKETASNLIYFLTGVLYAIAGHMKPVSNDTYMLTPNHMEIADENPGYEDGEAAETDAYGNYGGYGSGYVG